MPSSNKQRTATPRPKTIANLNAEARRINTLIKKEANMEKVRQEKRAATLAKRQATIQGHKEKIGGIVSKTHLQNYQIAKLVSQHLTPRNTAMAAIAFKSPAFKMVSRERKNNLSATLARYRNIWNGWYRGLTPNQRTLLSRNVAREMYGNLNLRMLSKNRNPLLFIKKGLTVRPPAPRLDRPEVELNWNTYRRLNTRYKSNWAGAYQALNMLSQPEVNAVLRRHGLPFSMTQARNNLMTRTGLTARRLERNRNRGRISPGSSLAAASGMLPERPPKGLKGYTGKRVRREYRRRLARAVT